MLLKIVLKIIVKASRSSQNDTKHDYSIRLIGASLSELHHMIGASLSEPHHVRSTVKSVFLLACLMSSLIWLSANQITSSLNGVLIVN